MAIAASANQQFISEKNPKQNNSQVKTSVALWGGTWLPVTKGLVH